MASNKTHNTLFVMATAIAVAMFVSCKNNLKDVQKIGIPENEPIGVAEDINLKYTDSGKIKAILLSPKMFDYSNRDFAFNEFPQGINLVLYDDDDHKNTVVADYAIVYSATDLMDLQGHVRIATYSKDTLYAEQLFYDQKKEWLFTNKPVSFRTGSDLINGNGFDSDTKFTNAEVLEINGIITLDE